MNTDKSLKRFIEAQEKSYSTALAEIKSGRKQSHWMWFIFPQMRDLGYSQMAQYYGIKDKEEAAAYLKHPVLGQRLQEISAALLNIASSDAHKIFGSPDHVKLKSSMTLFATVAEEQPIFQQVFQKFFNGKKDDATLRLL